MAITRSRLALKEEFIFISPHTCTQPTKEKDDEDNLFDEKTTLGKSEGIFKKNKAKQKSVRGVVMGEQKLGWGLHPDA